MQGKEKLCPVPALSKDQLALLPCLQLTDAEVQQAWEMRKLPTLAWVSS